MKFKSGQIIKHTKDYEKYNLWMVLNCHKDTGYYVIPMPDSIFSKIPPYFIAPSELKTTEKWWYAYEP